MEFYTENLGLLQFLLDKQYHHVVLLLQCEFFPFSLQPNHPAVVHIYVYTPSPGTLARAIER